MIRLLLHIGVSLAGSAIALLIASMLIPELQLQPAGFLTAVAVFTLAQAILAPFVFNLARKHASPVLGGVGLISTLLALWVATLFPAGLRITGVSAWIFSTLCVWLVTALGGWILTALVINGWWRKRQAATM